MIAAAARASQTTATLQRVAVIAIAVLVFGLVFELVRRRALMERYALLWLFAAIVLVVLALWQGLLTRLRATSASTPRSTRCSPPVSCLS